MRDRLLLPPPARCARHLPRAAGEEPGSPAWREKIEPAAAHVPTPPPGGWRRCGIPRCAAAIRAGNAAARSEEHTSELQSHLNIVCRLLLEKKKSITPICPLT